MNIQTKENFVSPSYHQKTNKTLFFSITNNKTITNINNYKTTNNEYYKTTGREGKKFPFFNLIAKRALDGSEWDLKSTPFLSKFYSYDT